MKIEMKTIDAIKPYEANPRSNDAAVDAVARSIGDFGFRQPIVVDGDGIIVCGHTRFKAAQQLALTKVPVHIAKDLTPEQVRAYRLADNRTSDLAQWDRGLLEVELEALCDLGYEISDLAAFGFDDGQLSELSAVSGGIETDPDVVPEPPDDPITQPGDLWILGEHRLLCGDSSLEADVDRLCASKPVQLLNTDPPYNVAVEPRSNNAISAGLSTFPASATKATTHMQQRDLARHPEKGKPTSKKLRAKDRPLANDFVDDEEFARLLLAWFGNAARVLAPGRAFYCWGGYANIASYPGAFKATGLYFSQAIIWHKLHPVLGRKDFMGDHEWCFYGWREGAAHQFLGPNNIPDVWPIKKVSPQSMVHLTEKPVELAARAMEYSSKRGERVLDLFGGSGSTLIAAEQMGRSALLMEIDPAYCDVIVTRWEGLTGKKAKREGAGS
ncbi:MAG: chromosome partitioning protein ParB [Phycisphaerae bacterium]|jgi:DNA modification methylase|nr:chromosome partitioning protein ParB [Phycisphaerae bacterium]HCT45250.1 chromosome partitioning protein ParB [Phycisphaerales bacterium]